MCGFNSRPSLEDTPASRFTIARSDAVPITSKSMSLFTVSALLATEPNTKAT